MVSPDKLEGPRRPEHAPPRPSKLDPGLAALLSLTGVPLAICIAQVPGQSMPVGDETMRPLPLPTTCTASVTMLGGAGAKVAVTAASWVSVKSHPPVPVHAPLQPEKTMPLAGVPSRCTAEPEAT